MGEGTAHADPEEHWDGVYTRLDDTAVSWFEEAARCSLTLLDELGVGPSDSVVDVGAGASRLVDDLLRCGFADLTLLDVSEAGLDRTRRRLAEAGSPVDWVVTDVLAWAPDRTFDVWHDRAVLHFVTDPADVRRYVALVGRAVRPGGLVVIGTFAETGPTHCSGLPVNRYSPARLAATFGPDFEVVTSRQEDHLTPRGDVQPFTWLAMRTR